MAKVLKERNRLNLSKKLLAIGAISMAATLMVVVITWSATFGAREQINSQSSQIEAGQVITRLGQNWGNWRFAEAKAVADPQAENLEDASQARKTFSSDLDAAMTAPLNPEQQKLVSEIRSLVSGVAAEKNTQTFININQVNPKVSQLLGKLNDTLEGTSKQNLVVLGKIMETNSVVGVGVGVAGLVMILLLSYLVSRSISRSAHEISRGLGALADRDLTQKVEQLSNDEVGRMTKDLNSSVGNLSRLISGIIAAATSSSSRANTLQDGAKDVAQQAYDAQQMITAVSDNAQHVSDSISGVAVSTEELQSSISEISRNAATAADVAAEAAREAVRANEIMAELGQASEEISEVIETIRMVAEQTNMLAMNASIEASRAGEAGRGFAVVASEVKELALETQSAAVDVSQRITQIQEDVNSTAGSLEEITQIITHINDAQSTIAAAVEQQTATTTEIVSTVGESSGSASRVADNLSGIAQQTSMANSGLQEASAKMESVANQLDSLSSSLSQFKWEEVSA